MILRLIFSALITVSTLFLTGCNASAAAPSVTLEDMRVGLDNPKIVVIDIREPSEHALGVAKGARLVPMGQVSKRLAELPQPTSDQTLLVVCNTQNRSSKVVEQLRAQGFTNASYVKDGMSQWMARGWPTVNP